MKMNGSGCVFDNYGRVPETLYCPEEEGSSAIEKAVFNNQPKEVLAAIEVSNTTLIFATKGITVFLGVCENDFISQEK